MWYCLDSSRLSTVVRVARFNYSPGLGEEFPQQRRGESVGLRGRNRDQGSEISCQLSAERSMLQGVLRLEGEL